MQLGKPIIEWKSILIDTGVILSLFRAQNGSVDEGVLFVDKLITFLCKNKTGKSENRTIYISTVTLGELITAENSVDKIRRILKVLDSDNVEFLSYDTVTALEFNIKLQPYITKENLHLKAQELGFKTGDYGTARQWIYADYMIAMTAFVKNVDVIITLDKKTFYPVCKDFKDTQCILAYPELFEHFGSFILNYDYKNVDNFLDKKPFKTLNEIEASKPPKPVQMSLLDTQNGDSESAEEFTPPPGYIPDDLSGI